VRPSAARAGCLAWRRPCCRLAPSCRRRRCPRAARSQPARPPPAPQVAPRRRR
jgi:hypothetical protein